MSLLSTNLQQLNAGSAYKFSATKIQDLGASEYTIVDLVFDASSSVYDFAAQLEQMVKTVVKACDKSPRRDNLLVRLSQFNDDILELHGYKLLRDIKEDDYNGILKIGGMTALVDGCDSAVQTMTTYGKQLTSQDYLVNGIVFVATDGMNNRGSMNIDKIKKSLEAARKSECLESIRVILIGVTNNDTTLDTYLQDFKDQAGVDQYVSIGTATAGKLAKLAEFVSQSISSTSQALGTGAPSQPLNSQSFKF